MYSSLGTKEELITHFTYENNVLVYFHLGRLTEDSQIYKDANEDDLTQKFLVKKFFRVCLLN